MVWPLSGKINYSHSSSLIKKKASGLHKEAQGSSYVIQQMKWSPSSPTRQPPLMSPQALRRARRFCSAAGSKPGGVGPAPRPRPQIPELLGGCAPTGGPGGLRCPSLCTTPLPALPVGNGGGKSRREQQCLFFQDSSADTSASIFLGPTPSSFMQNFSGSLYFILFYFKQTAN